MRYQSGAENRQVNSADNKAFKSRPLSAPTMAWVKPQAITLKKEVKTTSRSSLQHKGIKTA